MSAMNQDKARKSLGEWWEIYLGKAPRKPFYQRSPLRDNLGVAMRTRELPHSPQHGCFHRNVTDAKGTVSYQRGQRQGRASNWGAEEDKLSESRTVQSGRNAQDTKVKTYFLSSCLSPVTDCKGVTATKKLLPVSKGTWSVAGISEKEEQGRQDGQELGF